MSDDEFEFPDLTEEELSQIDLVSAAAFATQPVAWSATSAGGEIGLEVSVPDLSKLEPRSRKSSGHTVIDLTEEEFKLLDQSVEDLESRIRPRQEIERPPATHSHTTTQHIENSLEASPSPTRDLSPARTLGRDSSASPTPTTMSLYSLFRSSRNSLSVSDLVGPAWCELQYDYGLRGGRHLPVSERPAEVISRTGKVISVQKDVATKNEVIKQKGTTVHKKLEREIRPTEIAVTTVTQEDRWGLKLLDMVSNIRILIDEGRCREMPVMGFIQGQLVTGIVDEIIWTAAPPISPTISGHFSNEKRLYDSTECFPRFIHILDNKTRGVSSIPKPRDSYQSRLQLMLYKLLLDTLLKPSSPSRSSFSSFSFPDIWAHQSVNPLEPFSSQFLEESAPLVASNQLGPMAAQAKCLNDLVHVWDEVAGELAGHGRLGDDGEVVSKTLKLVYRLRERAGKYNKRSFVPDDSPQDINLPNEGQFLGSSSTTSQYPKKPRADSEDVELQRAIYASLVPNPAKVESDARESTAHPAPEDFKGETDIEQEPSEPGHTLGGCTSSGEDLQRALQESIKTHQLEKGKDATSLSSFALGASHSLSNRRKAASEANIIGVVEFEHDQALLEQHLSSVLDFWHDRRPPRGVAMEDTGRCTHCEFSDGCEWLEARATEIVRKKKQLHSYFTKKAT